MFCQIKNLTRHLFADWKKIGSPEEYEIMKSYAQNSRRFCLIYSGEEWNICSILAAPLLRFRPSSVLICTLQYIAQWRYLCLCQCPLYRSYSISYCPSINPVRCYRRIRDTISWTFVNISCKFFGTLSWPGRFLWPV